MLRFKNVLYFLRSYATFKISSSQNIPLSVIQLLSDVLILNLVV